MTRNEPAELTARGLALGVLITLVFTAANVYFGLKAGLTFATSIPATVMSMALLQGFKGASVQENNIVQTVASAAGTLSSIIFVLPGLIMIGWWSGVPFGTCFLICALGGVLGVMYSVPLRRALVTGSDLPYPEGVACAQVLKAAHYGTDAPAGARGARTGLRVISVGAVASAAFALIVATQLFASDVARYFRVGARGAVSGFDFSLSFALLAVGHLVGLWVGIAMLVGILIGWGVAVPFFSALHPQAGAAADVAFVVWSQKVRLFGAGSIGVAAIWTLIQLARPVFAGLQSARRAARQRRAGRGAALPRTERDIPIGIVGAVILLALLPLAAWLADFSTHTQLSMYAVQLTVGGVLYIGLMSFLVAAVVGYMAGLIGASNSPISGVGILVVIGAALLLLPFKPLLPAGSTQTLIAFALLVTSVVIAAATISNDNLQDLKTGQLVDATPWRQQLALVIGVIAGAVVIPPALELLNRAYGFAGAPGSGVHALPAPQAALISTLARGVLGGDLDWSLIAAGAGVGVLIIALDALLERVSPMRLPPLAVGMGIYLPVATTLMTVVGAIGGWLYERRADRGAQPQQARQLGVLLASGMIVGESLVGILLAGVVVLSGNSTPLAVVGAGFAERSLWLGGLGFVLLTAALYAWIGRLGAPARSR